MEQWCLEYCEVKFSRNLEPRLCMAEPPDLVWDMLISIPKSSYHLGINLIGLGSQLGSANYSQARLIPTEFGHFQTGFA